MLPRARALLVVAPHPDDEAVGAHALIGRWRRRGAAVRVLVVSDGGASHPPGPGWPRARLVAARRRETLGVLRAAGVGAGAVGFAGLPDGDLVRHAGAARRALARAAARCPRPLLVAGPVAGDDHPDHRAVAAALSRLRGPGVRRLGYPVWPAGARLPRGAALVLTGAERAAKRRALRGYRTQTGRVAGMPAGFALTLRQLAAFAGPAERFAAA